MHECRYLILGGGVAGGYAARELVERGARAGEVTVVSADARLPYERPPLTKKYLAGVKEEQDIRINSEEFYRDRGVEVRLRTAVEGVDLDDRRLRTAEGDEFRYERLLLATGSRPRLLKMRRPQLNGLFYLRSFDDARRIRITAEHSNHAVLIGGGYIGLETSATLARKGLNVTLVTTGDGVLSQLFTPEMSASFEDYYRERGVAIRKGVRPRTFVGSENVEGVVLDNGETLPAQLVVVAVGVRPALDFLKGTRLESDEGLAVDSTLQTVIPGVFAAGDIAIYPDPVLGRPLRVEHWDNAVEQAKCAARNMLGEREAFAHLPYFFSDMFDRSWEFWGSPEGAEEVVYRGEVREGEFSAWWLKEGRLVGLFTMGRPEEERELGPRWIQERRVIFRRELEGEHLPDSTRTVVP